MAAIVSALQMDRAEMNPKAEWEKVGEGSFGHVYKVLCASPQGILPVTTGSMRYVCSTEQLWPARGRRGGSGRA